MHERIKPEDVKVPTGYRGSVTVPPPALVKAFGEPDPADRYKTSGEYWFRDGAGHVFSIYDWKQTSSYQAGLLAPEQFWAMTEPMEFNIGADAEADVGAFLAWLTRKVLGLKVADHRDR